MLFLLLLVSTQVLLFFASTFIRLSYFLYSFQLDGLKVLVLDFRIQAFNLSYISKISNLLFCAYLIYMYVLSFRADQILYVN